MGVRVYIVEKSRKPEIENPVSVSSPMEDAVKKPVKTVTVNNTPVMQTVAGQQQTQGDRVKNYFESALANAKGYSDYVKKNGNHFTEKLAEFAVRELYSGKKIPTEILAPQSRVEMKKLITDGCKLTVGDIMYLTAVFACVLENDFADGLQNYIKGVSKYLAMNTMYDGAVFIKWCTEVIGRDIKLEWDKYL